MILALDTALETCSVALYDTKLVAFLSEPMVKGHAERLMPMVQELFEKAGVTPTQLTSIAVTVGPGSFTGLRVALAAAKAMGVALDIPVNGVSTLDALSFPYQGEVISLIDARHDKSYAQITNGDEIMLKPALYENQALKALFNKQVLTGSGAKYLSTQPVETQVTIENVALVALKIKREATPFYLKDADVTPQIKGIIARV